MNYLEQLQTPEWKARAEQVKQRDGYKCQICGKNYILNAHHVLYEPDLLAWEYPDNYLITLCDTCHLYEHSIIDNIKHLEEVKELLLSGMMGIDIYRKFKSKEPLIYDIPF